MSIKESYLNLITSQHKNKPKYMSVVEKLLQPHDSVFELAIGFDDFFDIDLAGGKQQDMLGDIIGRTRVLDYQDEKHPTGVLDDNSYRNIQKAKIIRNLWNGKIEDLYDKWLNLFGTPILIKDNQDMSLDIMINIDNSIEMQSLVDLVGSGLIVPKPAGVRLNYKFRLPDLNCTHKIYIGMYQASGKKTTIGICQKFNTQEMKNKISFGMSQRSGKRTTIFPATFGSQQSTLKQYFAMTQRAGKTSTILTATNNKSFVRENKITYGVTCRTAKINKIKAVE